MHSFNTFLPMPYFTSSCVLEHRKVASKGQWPLFLGRGSHEEEHKDGYQESSWVICLSDINACLTSTRL